MGKWNMTSKTTLNQDFSELIHLLRYHGNKFANNSPFGGHAPVAYKTKEFEEIRSIFIEHVKTMKLFYQVLNNRELDDLMIRTELLIENFFLSFKRFLNTKSMEYENYFLKLQELELVKNKITMILKDNK